MDYLRFAKERIRRAREDKHLSQEQLAKLLRVTQAKVSDLERGDSKISVEQLVKLSRILQQPITYFFPDELFQTQSKFESQLLSMFRKMSERWQRSVVDKIRREDYRIFELIEPYEKAGIPEEFYDRLIQDAYDQIMYESQEDEEAKPRMTYEEVMQKAKEDKEPYERFVQWRKNIDAKVSTPLRVTHN